MITQTAAPPDVISLAKHCSAALHHTTPTSKHKSPARHAAAPGSPTAQQPMTAACAKIDPAAGSPTAPAPTAAVLAKRLVVSGFHTHRVHRSHVSQVSTGAVSNFRSVQGSADSQSTRGAPEPNLPTLNLDSSARTRPASALNYPCAQSRPVSQTPAGVGVLESHRAHSTSVSHEIRGAVFNRPYAHLTVVGHDRSGVGVLLSGGRL